MNSRSRKKRSTGLLTTALVLIAFSVSILLAEYFLRAFFPQRLYYNISQWDSYVGFTLIPNIDAVSKHKDYTMRMKINSRGLRDREFPEQKPSDVLRIGVFGDSFTFGEGVQNDEAYPKVLEKLLNNDLILRSGYRIEVLNFGIGKTGTSQQLAWYRKEGRKYQLDMVILGFLSVNDFGNNWNGVFYLKDDELVHNPTAYSTVRRIQKIVYRIPYYRWLAGNSHLVNMARKGATILDDKLRKKRNTNRESVENRKKVDVGAESYRLTLHLIDAFQQEASDDGSQFMVVNLPAKNQKLLSAYEEESQVADYIKKDDALVISLGESNMRVLDLVPVFSTLDVSKYYFVHDGHMTASGHQVVAGEVYKSILPDVIKLMQ